MRRGFEPRTLVACWKPQELPEATGPQQVIKTEKNTVYERGNEAISAWLSEAILELYRKISKTKKRETFNFFFHSPQPPIRCCRSADNPGDSALLHVGREEL